MTNRTSPMRRQSRFPVSWPVLYGGAEFLAEGTVLDLTRIGWRVAGAMPVVPGMPLTLAGGCRTNRTRSASNGLRCCG